MSSHHILVLFGALIALKTGLFNAAAGATLMFALCWAIAVYRLSQFLVDDRLHSICLAIVSAYPICLIVIIARLYPTP